MPAYNPVIELIKVPVPAPSVVLLLAVVGPAEVLQHTPRTVTAVPPSLAITAPDDAVVMVIEDAAVVVSEAIEEASVLKFV